MRGLEARNLGTSRIPLGQLEAEPSFLEQCLDILPEEYRGTESNSGLSTPSFANIRITV